jgi:hypothetical protein
VYEQNRQEKKTMALDGIREEEHAAPHVTIDRTVR